MSVILKTGEEITLSFPDGKETACLVLAVFEASNGKQYIALLPDRRKEEAYLYRIRDETSQDRAAQEGTDPLTKPLLENISDDVEYEIVTHAFEEWLAENVTQI